MSVLSFPTAYGRPRVRTEAGSRVQPTYKMSVQDDGSRILRKVGEKNLYAQIQSFKDSTDVNYILARFASGDESALSKVQGLYGDFTEMPKTLQELSQRVIDAENIFYTLPIETREKFNHSPSEFFASFGSDKFNEIFTAKNPSLQPSAAESPQVTEPVVVTPQTGGTVNE